MIDAAIIVGASLGSAMKWAAPAVESQGFDKHHFMNEVMNQLRGQGVPGAERLVPMTNIAMDNSTEVSAPSVPNSGHGGPSLA